MSKRSLPRHQPDASAWAHPYGATPFGVLYADGGDDDGPGAEPEGEGDQDGDEGDDSTDEDDGDKPKPKPKPKPPSQRGKDDAQSRISHLEQELAAARKEAGKSRTEAKRQAAQDAEKALATKVAKALGLVEDDDEADTDPAKLMEQLKASQTTAESAQEEAIVARIEATVLRAAYALGVDGDRLLDSRQFCEEVDGLDPSNPKKFRAALEAVIKDRAEKNLALRAGGGRARRSGGDLPGGPPEGQRKQRGGLNSAIRGHYGT